MAELFSAYGSEVGFKKGREKPGLLMKLFSILLLFFQRIDIGLDRL